MIFKPTCRENMHPSDSFSESEGFCVKFCKSVKKNPMRFFSSIEQVLFYVRFPAGSVFFVSKENVEVCLVFVVDKENFLVGLIGSVTKIPNAFVFVCIRSVLLVCSKND